MGKKENPNWKKTEIVYAEEDLKEAIKNEIGTIIVKGELSATIYKNFDRNPKLRNISNWSIVLGLFIWPLLFAGIIGRILSATDFKNYKVKKIEEKELILVRK